MIYAALGLPACLALVAALRRGLLPTLSRLGAWLVVPWQLAQARAALLQAAALGLLVVTTFVLLPAVVLWAVQGDCSLLEAVYFCFSSLSTIGLGDLLPAGGRNLHPAVYHLGQLALLGESREPLTGAGWCEVGGHLPGGRGVDMVTSTPTPKSYPRHLSSPGYLLLGLLAMLLAVETFSELPQVRAMVEFFGYSDSTTDEDQGSILGQDELALGTPTGAAPPASAQAPACGQVSQDLAAP